MKLTQSALAVLFFACLPAGATVLYSTFLPGYGYATNSSYSIFGPTASFDAAEAMPFTVASTATVGSVDIALLDYTNTPGSYEVQLVTDNNNSPGGSVLESWYFSAPSINSPSVTNLPSAAVALTGGTQYWLEAFGLNSTQGGWFVESSDAQYYGVTRAYSTDQGSTWTVGPGYPMAFDILGTSTTTPEPSTFALVLLSLVGAACAWRSGLYVRSRSHVPSVTVGAR